jgi:hypothetical protein
MDDPLPFETMFSDELLRAVGLLFLGSAVAETALGTQAARCLCHPNSLTAQAYLSTAGMDLKIKLQTIEQCVRVCASRGEGKIEHITSSIRRQFEHRNAIAHNMGWPARPDEISLNPVKLTRKGVVPGKVFTAKQIMGFAQVMHSRVRQLTEELTELGITKPPERL